MTDLMKIAQALRSVKFNYSNEIQLHEGIEAVLRQTGYDPQREVRLGERDRIDFLVGDVGIEVKIGGSAASAHRQLSRYAKHDEIGSLIFASTRRTHANDDLRVGKPVEFVVLNGGLG